MFTQDLIRLLLRNPKSRRVFCGVIPIDHLTLKRVRRPCSFIINTDPSSQPGQHWFAVFDPRLNSQPIEIFDSFGLPSHQKLLFDFIKINSHRNQFIYNTRKIQADDSINCGKFSLLYIYFKAKGYTMSQY